MGPADFAPGDGIDVRPHPHIGLATVTYLFDGEMRHRDNLGYDQLIRPGDVNWMTAGRGIVHSERTDDDRRRAGQHMHGIQSWVALPDDAAETEPSFHHHPKDTLPMIRRDGVSMRLIAGAAYGETSPVKTYSPIFYLGVEASDGATIPLTDEYDERAIYIVDGALTIDGKPFARGKMVVFSPDANPIITAAGDTKAMLLGGAALGKRKIWWNLVATDSARIEKAKSDWETSAQAGLKTASFRYPPAKQNSYRCRRK